MGEQSVAEHQLDFVGRPPPAAPEDGQLVQRPGDRLLIAESARQRERFLEALGRKVGLTPVGRGGAEADQDGRDLAQVADAPELGQGRGPDQIGLEHIAREPRDEAQVAL